MDVVSAYVQDLCMHLNSLVGSGFKNWLDISSQYQWNNRVCSYAFSPENKKSISCSYAFWPENKMSISWSY